MFGGSVRTPGNQSVPMPMPRMLQGSSHVDGGTDYGESLPAHPNGMIARSGTSGYNFKIGRWGIVVHSEAFQVEMVKAMHGQVHLVFLIYRRDRRPRCNASFSYS